MRGRCVESTRREHVEKQVAFGKAKAFAHRFPWRAAARFSEPQAELIAAPQ